MKILYHPNTILAILLHLRSSVNAQSGGLQSGESCLNCDMAFSSSVLPEDYALYYENEDGKSPAYKGSNNYAHINSMELRDMATSAWTSSTPPFFDYSSPLPFYSSAFASINSWSPAVSSFESQSHSGLYQSPPSSIQKLESSELGLVYSAADLTAHRSAICSLSVYPSDLVPADFCVTTRTDSAPAGSFAMPTRTGSSTEPGSTVVPVASQTVPASDTNAANRQMEFSISIANLGAGALALLPGVLAMIF